MHVAWLNELWMRQCREWERSSITLETLETYVGHIVFTMKLFIFLSSLVLVVQATLTPSDLDRIVAVANRMEMREAILTDLNFGEPSSSVLHLSSPSASRPRASFRDARVSDECGFCRLNLLLGDNGTIASPSFPQPYQSDANCLWLLQTKDPGHRIQLTCHTVDLEPCGKLSRYSPDWRDRLVISPMWSFRKSWVYCGLATGLQSLKHTSICDQMAVNFRSDGNFNYFKGFQCTYLVIE